MAPGSVTFLPSSGCGPVAAGAPRSAAASAAVADVQVVIVSYRCRDLVLRTVGCLDEDGSGLAVTVTVVDNASGDGTVEALRQRFPDADVLDSGWNSGFARASNAGISRGNSRYVLLLNPDTLPARGVLETLVSFADAHPEAGVIAPRLRNPDGSDQRTARSFPTPAAALWGRRSPLTRLFPGNPWSVAYLAPPCPPESSAPFRVDWVSGAAMLVPRAVIERIGALDDSFFLFWEDADWCRRVADAGLEVWCVPTAEVVHDEGGSRAHGWSPRTIRWFHQGAYRYWVKHHAPSPWNPTRWAAAVLLTVRAAVLTASHGFLATRPQGHPAQPEGPS